jgi:hypothetical protein
MSLPGIDPKIARLFGVTAVFGCYMEVSVSLERGRFWPLLVGGVNNISFEQLFKRYSD